MPYIDGLPDYLGTPNGSDLVIILVGSDGVPGSGVPYTATLSQIIGSGTGNVTGPGSSVNGNAVVFSGAGGNIIADAGAAPMLNTTAAFTTAFLAWMASLPTTLPGSSGVAWNNGGIPSVS